LRSSAGVESAQPHASEGRFYALPSAISQNSLTTVLDQSTGNAPVTGSSASTGSGAGGGRSISNTRTVVVDSNRAWSARTTNLSGFTETWSSGAENGWVSRSGGAKLTVVKDGTVGNAAGSLKGSFAPGVLFPETDAFTVNAASASGEPSDQFLGDYLDVNYWNGWTFDFLAEDVLPSDLIFRVSDGTKTFLYNFADQVTSVGSWHAVRIYPLPEKFVGGTAAEFYNTVSNVSQIDIQVTRNGVAGQDYYVDNFGYFGNPIPEPNTLGFIIIGNALFMVRYQLARRRKRLVCED
jgi:hypothetical protein